VTSDHYSPKSYSLESLEFTSSRVQWHAAYVVPFARQPADGMQHNLCTGIHSLVGAFCFKMLPSVKFAEDTVLTFPYSP